MKHTSYFSTQQAGSNGLLCAAAAQSRRRASSRMVPKNAMMVPPSSPSLPLIVHTGNIGRLRREQARTDDSSAQQAGLNGLLRAARPGKAVAACSSSSCECDEGEKQSDFAVLKNTG